MPQQTQSNKTDGLDLEFDLIEKGVLGIPESIAITEVRFLFVTHFTLEDGHRESQLHCHMFYWQTAMYYQSERLLLFLKILTV